MGSQLGAQKAANLYGNYDMLANASECVEAPWYEDYDGVPGDGVV